MTVRRDDRAEACSIRAAELRARWRKIEATKQREEKRAALVAIRREALALLDEAGVPRPLRLLIMDLLGGPHLARDDWPAAKTALARIEAGQPANIGNKRLATLLHNETTKNTGLAALLREEIGDTKPDPTQIRRWRQDSAYKYLLWQFRRDEGGQ